MLPILAAIVWIGIFIFRKNGPSVENVENLRRYVSDEFSIEQGVSIRFGDRGFRFPDLINATQVQLDFHLKDRGIPYKYTLIDELPNIIQRPERANKLDTPEILFSPTETVPEETSTAGEAPLQKKQSHDTPFVVELALTDSLGVWLDLTSFQAYMTYDIESIHANDIPFFLAQTLVDHLFATDIALYERRDFISMELYVPEMKVNFVAVEDRAALENNPIDEAIQQLVKGYFEPFTPFVHITPHFTTVDVTKQKIPPHLLSNSSQQITFLYLTTLEGILNVIGGVHVHHLVKEKPQPLPADMYGTEYQEAVKKNATPRINISSFMTTAFKNTEDVLGLEEPCNNKYLQIYFTNKIYTIRGIVDILSILIKRRLIKEDLDIYKEICQLVDTILKESIHDWESHRQKVWEIYQKVSN